MQQSEPNRLQRVYRLRDLPQFVGLQRTVIAEMIKADKFPEPIKLNDSGHAVGWLESDLIAWQNARIASRKSKKVA